MPARAAQRPVSPLQGLIGGSSLTQGEGCGAAETLGRTRLKLKS